MWAADIVPGSAGTELSVCVVVVLKSTMVCHGLCVCVCVCVCCCDIYMMMMMMMMVLS